MTKHKNIQRQFLARTIQALLMGGGIWLNQAKAVDYYWDNNGATIGFGSGGGTWAAPTPGPTAGWSTNSNGAAAFVSVTTTTTDNLFLGNGAWVPVNNVAVTGPVDAGNITFGAGVANNFTLGTNGQAINLAATSTITAKSFAGTNIISSNLTGAATSLTKNGLGALTFTGNNTYAGATILNGLGVITLSTATGSLSGTSGITFNSATLTLTNSAGQGAVNRLSTGTITSNGGVLNYGNANTAANTYAEVAGTLALNSGQFNTILTTNLTTADGQTLTFGGLTRTGASNASAVTFSASSTSPQAATNKNMIVVSGSGTTTTGQIIGPWATTGTGMTTQTDYAVYNADYIVPANIGATTEDQWLNATDAYTSAGTATLTGNRTIAALRNTAGGTITLSDGVTGFNLATNGILNGAGALLTIDPGLPAGAVTAPGTGGQIHFTTGSSNSNIVVNAPISNNLGAVTLVKNGVGTLTLSNTGNNYSGGTVVNSGILNFASGTLGSGSITIHGAPTGNGSNTINNFGRLQWGAGNTQDISGNLVMVNGGNAILDTNGNDVIFATAVGSGSSSNFTKTGAGQLTFNANNTYTGETGVYFGGTLLINVPQTNTTSVRVGSGNTPGAVLKLGVNNAFPTNIPVMVDGQGVNTLDLNGFNQTVGPLSLGSNNGGSAGTVTGSGSSTLTITAGITSDGHNNGGGAITTPLLNLNGVTQNFSLIGSNANNSNLTISSVIQNGGINRTGTSLLGFLILSGANTFSGPTTNQIGMLRLDNPLALQNSPLNTTDSVNGDANNGLRTTVTSLTLGGLTGTKNLAALFTTNGTNPGQYNTVNTLTLNPGVGQNYSYTGAIADGAGGMTLSKTGLGTQKLGGANTYTGATMINEGVLLINGSTDAASAVTVASGASLGGTGTISGASTVDGSVAPGDTGIGTLSTGGNVTWNAGNSWFYDLGAGGGTIASPGTGDLLNITGDLVKGTGSAFTFNFNNTGLAGTYKLVDWTGSTTFVNGDFTGINIAGGLTPTFTVDGTETALYVTLASGGGPPQWIGTGNWTTTANWQGAVPNSATAVASFLGMGTGAVTVDAPQTVNQIVFNAATPSYTIGGSSVLSVAGTTPSITNTTGSNTITAPLNLANGTAINVTAGTLAISPTTANTVGTGVTATVNSMATLTLGGTANALNSTTNVANAGTLTVSGTAQTVGNISGAGSTTVSGAGNSTTPTLIANDIDQASLTINNGAYVRIAPSGTSTSVVTALTMGTTANLDISDNDVVVNNPTPVAAASSLTAVAARVNSGFAGGAGIVTTTTGLGLETVGFGLNSFLSYPTFNGVAVNDDSVLIKYTYFGDSNLDGFVTDDDLGYFLAGYGSDISANPWILGDYNHDGFTTDDDLGFFLAAYGSTPGLAGGGIQAIPEPSTLVLGTLAGLGLGALSLRRRRAK